LLAVPVDSALAFKVASTVAGEAVVALDRYSPPVPATCGEAMEVPDMVVVPPLLYVDAMLTPGAQMSTQKP